MKYQALWNINYMNSTCFQSSVTYEVLNIQHWAKAEKKYRAIVYVFISYCFCAGHFNRSQWVLKQH